VRPVIVPPHPASGDFNSDTELPSSLSCDACDHTPFAYQVWSSYAFPFRRYGTFSVSALISLVTLTFDLSTSKWGHGLPCHGLPSCHYSACYAFPFST